jgi:hypothetical protein
MINRLLAACGAASLALIVPLAAPAQNVPSYAQSGAPPSYATQDQQIHGRVISFDGGYSLQVRDDAGYIDNVRLHQGTVINPTGLTLASGMIVSVNGYNQGPFFSANEIDTPYTFYGPVPYYGGHPWYYYGPTISLGFFFGNAGWWHGGYYGRPVFVNRGFRTYSVRAPYQGGAFRGRSYVAPPERGGYVARRGATGSARGGSSRGPSDHGHPPH